MSTPKEKAKELVNKFIPHTLVSNDGWLEAKDEAKQCALIAVDEILSFMDRFDLDRDMSIQFKWWKEVKQEIETYGGEQ